MPDPNALSTKRAIFFALLLISIGWWSIRITDWGTVQARRSKLKAEAHDAYHSGDPEKAARLYVEILQLTDSVETRIVHLRKQAASYGKDGQYGKQLQNHLEARRLAARHGLDSLRHLSEMSIGSIYASCRADPKYCDGIEGTSLLSRWDAEKPILLLLLSLILFSVYHLTESN